jgi:hypothetical protein
MPKCDLKPWKIEIPQMVWINEDEDECVVVRFIKRDGEIMRCVSVEHLEQQETGFYWYEYCTDEGMEERWRQEFVNLLGIPETIEEE